MSVSGINHKSSGNGDNLVRDIVYGTIEVAIGVTSYFYSPASIIGRVVQAGVGITTIHGCLRIGRVFQKGRSVFSEDARSFCKKIGSLDTEHRWAGAAAVSSTVLSLLFPAVPLISIPVSTALAYIAGNEINKYSKRQAKEEVEDSDFEKDEEDLDELDLDAAPASSSIAAPATFSAAAAAPSLLPAGTAQPCASQPNPAAAAAFQAALYAAAQSSRSVPASQPPQFHVSPQPPLFSSSASGPSFYQSSSAFSAQSPAQHFSTFPAPIPTAAAMPASASELEIEEMAEFSSEESVPAAAAPAISAPAQGGILNNRHFLSALKTVRQENGNEPKAIKAAIYSLLGKLLSSHSKRETLKKYSVADLQAINQFVLTNYKINGVGGFLQKIQKYLEKHSVRNQAKFFADLNRLAK